MSIIIKLCMAFMLYFCVAYVQPLSAQNVSLSVNAPKIVEQDNFFHITYTINVKPGANFSLSSVDGLQPSGRPQTSSSNSISIINNKTTSSYQYTETHQFRAVKQGVFKIPIASITIDGKTYKSKSQEIEVVASSSTVAQGRGSQLNVNQQSNQSREAEEQKPQASGEDIFARVFVNKQSAYIGEPLYVSIKLYTLKNFTINTHSFPDFVGFYKKIIEQPQELRFEREVIDGKEYYAVLFQKLVVFPQKSGALTISPFKVDCNVITQVGTSIWNMYNRSDRREIATKPIVINVLPFPTGNSSDFLGAVGNFTISASTDVREIRANEAFSYKVTIQGTGNLALLQKPSIAFPTDFEVYEPKIIDNYTTTTLGDKGTKVYEYVIIPRHQGNYQIPSISFQFFNPQTKQYATINTQEIPILVLKSDAESSFAQNLNSRKEEPIFAESDIRYIKTGKAFLTKKMNFVIQNFWYWLFVVFIAGACIVYILLKRKQMILYANTSFVKQKKANKESQKRLKKARESMKNGDDTLYYNEVAKAMWGYVSDKFCIPQSELTIEIVREYLISKQLNESLIDNFTQILQTCEFARYAPVQGVEQKELLYSQADSIIQKFEQTLKKRV